LPEDSGAIDPKNYIYAKEYNCPCCDQHFFDYTVRASRVRFKSADTDLRNRFEPFDPLYYDALMCSRCGHTAMSAFMGHVTDAQAKRVQAEITSRFQPKEYPMAYTPADAIERMKYALLTAVVKDVKTSQMANICLKLSWVYRDAGDSENEKVFAKRALEAFIKALEKEDPPISGMDTDMVTYLIGELHRRTGNNQEAMKWIAKVLSGQGVKKSIKDKALEVKNLIDGK
jgi:uncharacterized protein (DUF2225 family)